MTSAMALGVIGMSSAHYAELNVNVIGLGGNKAELANDYGLYLLDPDNNRDTSFVLNGYVGFGNKHNFEAGIENHSWEMNNFGGEYSITYTPITLGYVYKDHFYIGANAGLFGFGKAALDDDIKLKSAYTFSIKGGYDWELNQTWYLNTGITFTHSQLETETFYII